MLRVIFGLNLEQQVNMETLRDRIKMFSVNQLAIYHTIIEAFNVVRKSSTTQVKSKWEHKNGQNYSLRRHDNMNLRVPDKGRVKCTGFSYHGAKLFNMLPNEARKCTEPESFKSQVKTWIWETIPSF